MQYEIDWVLTGMSARSQAESEWSRWGGEGVLWRGDLFFPFHIIFYSIQPPKQSFMQISVQVVQDLLIPVLVEQGYN